MAVGLQDVCKLYITKQQILYCIGKALQLDFTDNLRDRHPLVKFDSHLRGIIGELAISNWLQMHGIKPDFKNQLNSSNNIDVDLAFSIENSSKILSVEVKTSLIPDKDQTLSKAIFHRDIKLIKRGDKTIEDLEADVHLQIFFNQKAKAKDNWLKQQNVSLSINNLDDLYYKLAAYRYLNDVFFVGWISKNQLLTLHQPNEKTWTFKKSRRVFWRCNIYRDAQKPSALINFLKTNT